MKSPEASSVADEILQSFQPGIHPLILVSDPDDLLAEESILSALSERGFTLLGREDDPMALRQQIEAFETRHETTPLIVLTAGDLNNLPYDLWQQGQHVNLALHRFFPNLSYPVIKTLTNEQRWRLGQVEMPRQVLTRQGTVDFLLSNVFRVDWYGQQQPSGLIEWLSQYHTNELGQMPEIIADSFLDRLSDNNQFHDWPLAEIVASGDVFARFLDDQWMNFLRHESGDAVREQRSGYFLSFESDHNLQDSMPRLVRSGALQTRTWPETDRLPRWARAAVVDGEEQLVTKQADELLSLLEDQGSMLQSARWTRWQTISRIWAELSNLTYHPQKHLNQEQKNAFINWQGQLDREFYNWLRTRYRSLASQRLPPHHVHHIPYYLAYERRRGRAERMALLVMDGMSLADWLFIKRSWLTRHSNWRVKERLIIAQIPTITSVSRQALVSGLRPAEFAETITHNQVESALWTAFWAREDLPAEACAHVSLRPGQEPLPAVVSSSRIQALCLVYSGTDSLDDLIHHSNLGERHRQAALKLWLRDHGHKLEGLIEELLNRRYALYLASDHGHTEAIGMGQPTEGLTVKTRGKRARYYRTRNAAAAVQKSFPDTVLWEDDPLLPAGHCLLMPDDTKGKRLAFTLRDDDVVAHGGVTLDETVVPLVAITLTD